MARVSQAGGRRDDDEGQPPAEHFDRLAGGHRGVDVVAPDEMVPQELDDHRLVVD